jgi:hypothetical protein
LAPGHPIKVVVNADNGHIQVASANLNEMVSPDCCRVPISSNYDSPQFRPGQKRARGHGRRPPVKGPDGIKTKVMRGDPGGTSNSGDEAEVVPWDCIFLYYVIHGIQGIVHHLPDTTARAEDSGKPVAIGASLL